MRQELAFISKYYITVDVKDMTSTVTSKEVIPKSIIA